MSVVEKAGSFYKKHRRSIAWTFHGVVLLCTLVYLLCLQKVEPNSNRRFTMIIICIGIILDVCRVAYLMFKEKNQSE